MKDNQQKRQPMSRERIITAAVDVADAIGVDALTIRKLADALQVKPMTIYHYVENKEAIIDGMVDAVFNEIDLPSSDALWKDAIRCRSASARAVLARHPWAVPLMESRRNPGPATLQHHDAVLACFRNGGLSVEMTAHAYALIDAFIYGFAIQEASLPATSGNEMEQLAGDIMDSVPDNNYPHLMEFTAQHVLQPGYDFGKEFDFGLELILDGIEHASVREQ
ncbi:MAG: TetR/AcrR family transcriptional regulator [Granulosicoccus sp.]